MAERIDRSQRLADYVEKIRPIYEPEEIQAMLHHANQDGAIFLKFMIGSGFRDREAQHVTWRDIDFHNSLARVTAKPIWGLGRRTGKSEPCPCQRCWSNSYAL
jgi:integrase